MDALATCGKMLERPIRTRRLAWMMLAVCCAASFSSRARAADASPEKNPGLDRLVGHAVRYYEDFVKPTKKYRAPTENERAALAELAEKLRGFGSERDAEKVQFEIYEIGKKYQFEPLRDWFKAIYEVLFGQTQGPRFGSFAVLFGLDETAKLIDRALAGEFVS